VYDGTFLAPSAPPPSSSSYDGAPPEGIVSATAVAVDRSSVEERLQKLKELRDRQIITDLEYQHRRTEILQSI